MYHFRLYFLLLLIGITAFSCNNSEEDSSNAFIGGQIINPTSNHVVIFKDNVPLDTVYLDQKNRFGYKIENPQKGLYWFKHTPEEQILYIEPGDSLLLRVNLLDFDNSLHFSGKGSEKNNLLLESFLLNQNNTNLLLSYYKIAPEEFADKTDSIRAEQKDLLLKKHKKNNFSEDFFELAEKSIDYDSYDLRERYTYMVNKYYKEYSRQLTDDFHAYRSRVDFNDTTMQTSPSYIRFIENYLINQAMMKCARANQDNNDCYDLYDHENITSRINIIDSLTQLPLIKEHFFEKFGALGIIMAKEREEIVSLLELLEEKGFPKKKLDRLVRTGNLQLTYLPGRNVSDVSLLDTSGQKKQLKDIITKPTILFLWSIYSPENHIKNHKTIKNLREKYPEINFIGVNLDSEETHNWINTINTYGYDKNNEYQLNSSYSLEKEIYQNYLNKSLFIDPSGEVVIGDAFINSPNFESRILEFLNQ